MDGFDHERMAGSSGRGTGTGSYLECEQIQESVLATYDALLVNRGAVCEQVVGQQLLHAGPFYVEPEIFYWLREARGSCAEIDRDSGVTGIGQQQRPSLIQRFPKSRAWARLLGNGALQTGKNVYGIWFMDSHRKIDPGVAAKQGRLPLGLDEPSFEPGVSAPPAVLAAPVPAVPVSEPVVVVHAVAPVAATVAVEAAPMPMTDPAKPDAGAAVPAATELKAAPAPVVMASVPKDAVAGGVGAGMLTPRLSPIRKAAPVAGKAAGGMAPLPAAVNRPMGGMAGGGLQAEAGGAVLGSPRVVFTFGRVVRDHREKAGLDIPGLCQKTKVPKEFLENLEANRLEALPSPVYVKSYLRLLCREFAMDPAPCLEEYGRVQAARQGEVAAAPFTLTSENRETGAKVGYAPRQTQPKPEKQSAMLKKLNPALIAVGVVVVGLILVALVALVVNRSSAHKTTAGAAGATAEVDLDKFITPQQLPMKELPVPGR